MRLKVLLALGVLLLAFAGNATFTLLSIHRARQGVVANEAYLELQGSVDAAWKSLNDFVPGAGRGAPPRGSIPTCRWRCAWGASTSTTRWASSTATSRRSRARRGGRTSRTGGARSRRWAGSSTRVATELGTAAVAVDPKARPEFESHFATLTHNLNRMRRPLRGESGQIAQRLSDDEETALSMALGLGAAGLAVAGAAFMFTLRTLRPLSVLRARARQVAGGDYAQRTGVTSQRRDRRSGARVRRDGRARSRSASSA